jgi:hypothetical protein
MKYNIYFSIIELRLSVIIEKYILLSCNEFSAILKIYLYKPILLVTDRHQYLVWHQYLVSVDAHVSNDRYWCLVPTSSVIFSRKRHLCPTLVYDLVLDRAVKGISVL